MFILFFLYLYNKYNKIKKVFFLIIHNNLEKNDLSIQNLSVFIIKYF